VQSFEVRVAVPAADGGQQGWEIAASVYLPAAGRLPAFPSALVALPGAGYARGYFDLPVPGFSQAAHHARQGSVVIAIDHLGAGDSSIPPAEVCTFQTVAAANHAAVTMVLGRLRDGTLAHGVPAVDLAAVIGVGQSMGGHILATMQAAHRTFDGVAMLGSSMVAAPLPVRPGAPEIVIPDGATPDQATLLALAGTDWNWAFHWEAGPAPEAPEAPHDLASLIAADIAAGLPLRQAAPPWGSIAIPACAPLALVPGTLASATTRIDVPVLLAAGERDLCGTPGEEVAAFTAATDISVLVVPRMAHMHNFAATRAVLWERLDEFIAHVTRSVAGRSGEVTRTKSAVAS
jgi:alpha-beta hydrolase superfamily lysophospholipase